MHFLFKVIIFSGELFSTTARLRELSGTWKNLNNFQVTCEYYLDHGACVPIRVHSVVVSTQHSEDIAQEKLRQDVMTHVIKHVIPAKYLDDSTVYHINPCGNFIIGGPMVRVLADYCPFSYPVPSLGLLSSEV